MSVVLWGWGGYIIIMFFLKECHSFRGLGGPFEVDGSPMIRKPVHIQETCTHNWHWMWNLTNKENTDRDLFKTSAQSCSSLLLQQKPVCLCVCVFGARSCNTEPGPSENRWPRRRAAAEAHVAGLLQPAASQWSPVNHYTPRPRQRPPWWETSHVSYPVMEDAQEALCTPDLRVHHMKKRLISAAQLKRFVGNRMRHAVMKMQERQPESTLRRQCGLWWG